MASQHTWQQAFQELLLREAGTSADASAIAAAARRLCEGFAQRLTPLVGDAGVAAIYARSLHLVRQHTVGLAPVPASDLGDGPFTHVQRFLEHQTSDVAGETAVAVLTTVGDLLASLIGESLTMRLLREAWPDDFTGGISEETTT